MTSGVARGTLRDEKALDGLTSLALTAAGLTGAPNPCPRLSPLGSSKMQLTKATGSCIQLMTAGYEYHQLQLSKIAAPYPNIEWGTSKQQIPQVNIRESGKAASRMSAAVVPLLLQLQTVLA